MNDSDGKVRMWRFTNTMKRQWSLENNSWQLSTPTSAPRRTTTATTLFNKSGGDAARLQNKILGLLSTAKSSLSSTGETIITTRTKGRTTGVSSSAESVGSSMAEATSSMTIRNISYPRRVPMLQQRPLIQHQKYKFKWFIYKYFYYFSSFFKNHNFQLDGCFLRTLLLFSILILTQYFLYIYKS